MIEAFVDELYFIKKNIIIGYYSYIHNHCNEAYSKESIVLSP